MDRIAYLPQRYQLKADYQIQLGPSGIRPVAPIQTAFYDLTPDGQLTIKRGYAWDGASGPVPESPCLVRGTLIHDVLYELMRAGLLPREARSSADLVLRDLCRQDGMPAVEAWAVYHTVRAFGGKFVYPGTERPTLYFPPE